MSFAAAQGKSPGRRTTKLLFLLCWAVYTAAYLGRLNYAACLVEITAAEGWSKGQAGMVATGFFITYGIGQLLSGAAGDRLPPKYMVAAGLGFSGLLNLLFPGVSGAAAATVLWCLNGFAQSMLWSPLVRLLSEWLPDGERADACGKLNSSVPAGTLAAYALSAGAVYLGNWRAVFFIGGTVLAGVALVWLAAIAALQKKRKPAAAPVRTEADSAAARVPLRKIVVMSALPLACAAILAEGMLKDGITTWIPTFLEEQFHMSAVGAILSTALVPLVSLAGVYLASWMNRRVFRNELLSTAVLFAACFAALLVLRFFSGSLVRTLVLLALSATLMMGTNTLLLASLPSYFARYGICSTVSGALGSVAYVGSALSSYLNGAVSEQIGWTHMTGFWCVYAAAGGLICLLSAGKWGRFTAGTPAE